jgi:hypothetical protein
VRLLELAEDLALKTGDPRMLAAAVAAAGWVAFLQGRWRAGKVLSERATILFREQRSAGLTWEQATIRMVALTCAAELGEIDDVARRAPVGIQEFESRGDVYAARLFRTGKLNLAWLARGDVEGARHALGDARAMQGAFNLQDAYDLLAACHIDLYTGDTERAADRIDRAWPEILRARLLIGRVLRVWFLDLHARTRLAHAARCPARKQALLGEAERDARALLREPEQVQFARAHALLIRGGIARLKGAAASAMANLQSTARVFDEADMALHATLARLRLGQLIGGTEGAALVGASEARLLSAGITDATRWAAVHAPGLDPSQA